jgi:NTE family protein
VDGGLINPVPIAPTLKDLTDITIAVNLNGSAQPLPKDLVYDHNETVQENHYRKRIRKLIKEYSPHQKNKDNDWGFFEVIQHCLETMQNTISRLKLAAYSPDVIIDIPKNACGTFEFYRATEMIALGRSMAERALISKITI